MQTISLIWGILAVMGMIVGLIPCLGALNWLNIPFAGIGFLISIIALAGSGRENKNGAIAGLVCCGAAMFFGIIRLFLGGGVI